MAVINVQSFRQFSLARCSRALAIGLWAALLAGCSVFFISGHDQASVDRTSEISKSVLKFYQELLTVAPAQRKTALASTLAKSEGDIESLIRLHLLREQARVKNEDSAKIVDNTLKSWQAFAKNHADGDSTALTDAALAAERGIMERHLRAAFTAEEAKKLGGS